MIPTQGGHQLFLSESGLTIYGRQNWPKMFAYLEPGSVRTNAFSKWFKSPCQQICVSYNWLNLLIMWLKHFCLCNHCLTTRCPEVLEWMLPITGDLEECSGIHPLYVQGYTLIKSYASATNIKWTRVVISQRKMDINWFLQNEPSLILCEVLVRRNKSGHNLTNLVII